MPSHYNPDEDVTPHSVDERMHAGYLYLALNTIRYLVLHPVDVHYNLDDEDTTPCIGTSDSFIIFTESRDDEDEDKVLHTSESRIHIRSALLTLSTGNLMYLFDKIPRNTDCIIPKCCSHPPPVLFPVYTFHSTMFFPIPKTLKVQDGEVWCCDVAVFQHCYVQIKLYKYNKHISLETEMCDVRHHEAEVPFSQK
ncbi:hypothetical protein PCE1_002731 [Barthelona sp. PCE]